MSRPLSLILVFGGRSGEHEVSVMSATSIAAALDPKKYDVVPVRIDKKGRWLIDPSIMPADRRKGLRKDARRHLVPDASVGHLLDANGKQAERIDVIFPIVHGTYGEDGCLQGLFELAGHAYVGSGVLGSSVGMDKVVQKRLLAQAGIPIVPFVSFGAAEWKKDRASLTGEIAKTLGFPCFVKPANLGSSVGVSKAHHMRELADAVALAHSYDAVAIVEKAVPKAREIECAVLGGAKPEASVLGEIVPSNEFYDYNAKYVDGKSATIVPADLPKTLATNIRDYAVRTFAALGAQGMARVDCFVGPESLDVVVNEINTLPGFTSISMYPKLWAATGVPYPELLDRLVGLALDAVIAKRAIVRSYEPVPTKKPARTRA
ncbi:MAG TPA: D-alanine--D-alanine ligase family protein [Candidatus Eisenbacteria bacterium]|nr:D-alanine--D-alanine ligase family protein [Candidatus Eisenbacteria bacterium]